MTRIFGFLLICIGMQFLLTGVGDFFGWIREGLRATDPLSSLNSAQRLCGNPG